MPMCPELIIAFLAVIRIGGIVLPLFSGYGADAVATRLRDCEATLLITADGFWRRGQQVLIKPVADAAVDAAPVRAHVIVVPAARRRGPVRGRDIGVSRTSCRWRTRTVRPNRPTPRIR